MAIRKAVDVLDGGPDLPEGFWYSVKRRLLGPPLVNEQLGEQRLSKPLALSVSAIRISSVPYADDEMPSGESRYPAHDLGDLVPRSGSCSSRPSRGAQR